jgi:hypothetical protein
LAAARRAAPPPKPKAWHPELNEKGEKVGIFNPHKATGPESWTHGDQVTVATPSGAVPAQLNGAPFAPWTGMSTNEAASACHRRARIRSRDEP